MQAGTEAECTDSSRPKAASIVDLLPAPSGERASRRQRRRRRQRLRSFGVLAVALLLGGTAAALIGIGGDALWDKIDEQDDLRGAGEAGAPTAGGGSTADTAEAPTQLIVQQDEVGAVTGVTVVVPEADSSGGAMLLVPVGAMVEVPSFGLEPVTRAHELGGLVLLQQSVENLLGIRFDEVVVAGPGELAALVEPLGSLTVEVPERVEHVDERGRVRVLFEEGPVEIAAEEVPLLLAAEGQSTDLGRLVRHQAFWSAWLRAITEAAGGDGGSSVALPPELSGLLEGAVALTAGDVRFEVLPVQALSAGVSGDADLYQVDRDELRALLARVAPHLTTADAEGRIEVQLLNGAGAPGLAQRVTPLLVAAGAEVKLVGNADRFDYEETQIVYYDPDRRAAADAVRDALGVGQVVFSRQRLGVVDVTVVVGSDLSGGESPGDERE